MTENLIFLDFDGVINNNIDKLTMEAIDTLKKLTITYNAKIVVISSLLGSGEEERKKRFTLYLNKLGFHNIDFIDPNFEGYYLNKRVPSRALGIIDYLKKYPNFPYVILDDEFHTHYRRLGLNYYRTNGSKGLQKKDLEKIEFKITNGRIYNEVEYHNMDALAINRAVSKLVRTLNLIERK